MFLKMPIHLNDAIQRVKHPAPPSVPYPLEWKEKLIYEAIPKGNCAKFNSRVKIDS